MSRERIGPGVWFTSTPSHGYMRVDSTRNARIHPAWRIPSGSYEEDCDWAIVAVTFPDLFKPEVVTDAHRSAKDYHPDGYAEVFGVTLTGADSLTLAEREFDAEHCADLVTIAAWGSWHDRVPAGLVGVCATVGGHRGDGYSTPAKRYYLVPKAEYGNSGGRFGLVIDETRHREIDPIV